MERQRIPLTNIIVDENLNVREELDNETIERYMDCFDQLPPIVVFKNDDIFGYLLADGFHRCEAAKRLGKDKIDAEVKVVDGEAIDAYNAAEEYAALANLRHGKPLTRAERRKAVERILKLHYERTDRWIAEDMGVDHKSVRKYREELISVGEIPQLDKLTGKDGKEYPYEKEKDEQPSNEAIEQSEEAETIEIKESEEITTETEALIENTEEAKGQEGIEEVTQVTEQVEEQTNSTETPEERRAKPTFNFTNEKIEWAKWTWNPVTGCKHGCAYCYARDIANRFYPEKFEPTFRQERLEAPKNTTIPDKLKDEPGIHNVFVCSMGDLFGQWVQQEWIDAVMEIVHESPEWNFIFLTKNPKRMIGIDFPDNAWVGATVDIQARVEPTVEAFSKIKAKVKFISVEPMLEEITFHDLDLFDWVIIGGRGKSSKLPECQPEWEWVKGLLLQAWDAGCKVYFKPNLTVRPKEYPEL